MGAGLAWLMVSQNRPAYGTGGGSFMGWLKRTTAMAEYDSNRDQQQTGDSGRDSGGMRDKANQMYGKATDALGSARDRASDMAGSARDRASDMMGRARETVSGASETVSRTMSSAVDTVSSRMPSTRSIANFMQEEPMVLAGVGLALGAIIGAMVPSTEIEERYLGPTAEQLKEQAREAAREQWERGKQYAAEGWDEAKEAALRTWEDAKDEAQKSWENTQERVAKADSQGQTGQQTPLVPSNQ
jgi:ElaB/YqjD/DUF883 family membrane-anchored ribosome-binding protein